MQYFGAGFGPTGLTCSQALGQSGINRFVNLTIAVNLALPFALQNSANLTTLGLYSMWFGGST